MDVANANNGDFNGLIAGLPFGNINPNGSNFKNYVHVANNYNLKVAKSNISNRNPTTGIRAISNNNGQSPLSGNIAGEYAAQSIVTIDGTYSADLTAGYGNGVYVSGKWDDKAHMPIVNLNHTDIKITGSGNALKIGKKDRSSLLRQYRDGWGAGELNFKAGARVNIDQSAATGEAIALTYGGSVLNAPETEAFKVVSQDNTIRVGNDILTNNVQDSSQLISASINNADFTQTPSNTNSMFRIDPNQAQVAFNFTGDNTTMTSADNGWLTQVQDGSKLEFTASGAGQMTGLTTLEGTGKLNNTLDQGFTWNLREHANGTKIATFTETNLNGESLINAFKGDGTAAFTLNGNVNSTDSTISLQDGSTGDVLTIAGNYAGINGNVLFDTEFGDDTSPTDLLKVTGNTSGTTFLKFDNIGGVGMPTDKGIEVVDVGGDSADGSFLLVDNAPIVIGDYDYYLYRGFHDGNAGGDPKDNNDWFLRSTFVSCRNGGSSTTGGSSTGTSALGCVTNDTIEVKDDAVVNTVEGAGGSDTIHILGNASVTGDVLGGGEGQDNSAATDMGDIILVNTTGTIGGKVDGGIGDDLITITGASTVTGAVIGGLGNDSIVLADTAKVGSIEGNEGDDTFTWSGTSKITSFDGGLGSDVATVTSTGYTGAQILDGGDDTSVADGFIDTLNLNGLTVTANGGNIRNWEVVNLNNTFMNLSGTLTTGKDPGTGLNINTGSTLATSGNSVTVVGNVKNSGTIDLNKNNPAPGQGLRIDGDYLGVAGSRLIVDTAWNNPNAVTSDTLGITGSASGTTQVTVPGGIMGNVTQADQVKVAAIPVVTVGKAHADNVFTGVAATTNAGEAQLVKVGNNYFWTLLAREPGPDPEPGPGPGPDPEPGPGPGTGIVKYSTTQSYRAFSHSDKSKLYIKYSKSTFFTL